MSVQKKSVMLQSGDSSATNIVKYIARASLPLTLIAFLNIHTAYSTTVYWANTGGDSKWSTANNWSGLSVPQPTDTANIPFSNPIIDGGNASVDKIILGQGASIGINGGTLTTRALSVTLSRDSASNSPAFVTLDGAGSGLSVTSQELNLAIAAGDGFNPQLYAESFPNVSTYHIVSSINGAQDLSNVILPPLKFDGMGGLNTFLNFTLKRGASYIDVEVTNSLRSQTNYNPIVVAQATVASLINMVSGRLGAAVVGIDGSENISFTQSGELRSLAKRRSPYAAFGGSQGGRSATQAILSALEQTGPISKRKGNHTLWADALYSFGNNKQNGLINSSRDTHEGIAVGFDVANKQAKQFMGIALGVGSGKSASKAVSDNSSKHKTWQFGIYNSIGLLENTRLNSFLFYTQNISQNQRVILTTGGSSFLGHSRSKFHNISFSNEISYSFKFKDHFSIKPSYGFNFNHSIRPAYSEFDAGNNGQAYKRLRFNRMEHQVGLGAKKTYLTTDADYALGGQVAYGRLIGSGVINDTLYSATGAGAGIPLQIPSNGRNTVTGGISLNRQSKANDHHLKLGYSIVHQKYRLSQVVVLKASWMF